MSIQQNIGGKVIMRSFILAFVPECCSGDQMEEDLGGGAVHVARTTEKKSSHRILIAKHEKRHI
jgi:hypothetical protein